MNLKSKSTLKKFESILKFKDYSKSSIKIYLNYAKHFLCSFPEDIYHISVKRTEEFLINKQYTSKSQKNQYISAIKLLYKYIVKCKLGLKNIERPRKERKLPRVIDIDYLLNQIDKIENIKHKSILSIALSLGLRVSEVINLKIDDIDSNKMIIYIRNSKGNKDRVLPLTKAILNILRKYYFKYRPKEYLFNGQKKLKYSTTSCNKIVKKYIGKDYHFHLLRHSSLSNLADKQVNLKYIQDFAGHNSVKSTEIYIHTSINIKQNLPLAL